MTGAATDERRRRWTAHIDLQKGVTRVRPVDDDPRPGPQASGLLDAMRRPERAEPEHVAPAQTPTQPWMRGSVAQPQDADRRAGADVRIPAAQPAAASPEPDPVSVGAASEEVTDQVVVRVRQMLGLPPEEPPVAPIYGEDPLLYAQLNPAGAFVQASDDVPVAEAFAPSAEPNPAGAFAED